jgi:hypothetical protein
MGNVSPDRFLSQLLQTVAMWADENLFGHGLSDDDYEREAMRFADDAHEAVRQVLMERPVR